MFHLFQKDHASMDHITLYMIHAQVSISPKMKKYGNSNSFEICYYCHHKSSGCYKCLSWDNICAVCAKIILPGREKQQKKSSIRNKSQWKTSSEMGPYMHEFKKKCHIICYTELRRYRRMSMPALHFFLTKTHIGAFSQLASNWVIKSSGTQVWIIH